ncbi:hypothetical protein ACKGJO_06805 [Gracilimonas sp. Q87]|uniref:hypothetical protein n=1 Tax=Gracilimonas sp. Q87 TaxID=3384766 RepID=UPI003983EA61
MELSLIHKQQKRFNKLHRHRFSHCIRQNKAEDRYYEYWMFKDEPRLAIVEFSEDHYEIYVQEN